MPDTCINPDAVGLDSMAPFKISNHDSVEVTKSGFSSTGFRNIKIFQYCNTGRSSTSALHGPRHGSSSLLASDNARKIDSDIGNLLY